VWISGRNWPAVALVQDVRSDARYSLCALMKFSAYPRAIDFLVVRFRQPGRLVTTERLSAPPDPASTRAMATRALIVVAPDLFSLAGELGQRGFLDERADPADRCAVAGEAEEVAVNYSGQSFIKSR
jgi:hypothetical protein